VVVDDLLPLELTLPPPDVRLVVGFAWRVVTSYRIASQLIASGTNGTTQGFGNSAQRITFVMQQKQLIALILAEMGVVFSSYQDMGVLLQNRMLD